MGIFSIHRFNFDIYLHQLSQTLEDHKKEVEMLFNKLHNNYDKRGKVTNLTPDYII
jgi:hypothetical protein